MTQQFLNSPQITTITKQVRGECVAQGVRCNMGWQANIDAQPLNQSLCRAWPKSFAAAA